MLRSKDELNTCDIFVGIQRSMSLKHGFNQTNIALMSVEKLIQFQLKWVIYMSKNIFCFIKTCVLISNIFFTTLNLEHFCWQLTLNASQR